MSMNIIKKYWDSVYVYILLLVPALCMCAGVFWSVFKLMGHYSNLQWIHILVFDCSQIVYLVVSLYFIYKNKKDSTYINEKLSYVKGFIVFALFVQYNFILYLFASVYVWECTFIFLAIIAFLFDTKLTLINLLLYFISLVVAHVRNPEVFLPLGVADLVEIISFRIVVFVLTSLSIMVIVYFAEFFLVQAREMQEDNINLMEKQLEYYKDMELLDSELRKFRHDIDNHFVCMEYLFNNKKTDELKEYFDDLKHSNSFKQKIYLSGNDVIDAILHHDLSRYCDKEVEVTIYGSLSEINTVSSMDMCTVFSNLLSNAIASANKCSGESKSCILIRFSSGKKYFSISMSNTLDIRNEERRHTKKDKNHGHGINKIKDVVEKYNGKYEKNIDGQMINITVYLPI